MKKRNTDISYACLLPPLQNFSEYMVMRQCSSWKNEKDLQFHVDVVAKLGLCRVESKGRIKLLHIIRHTHVQTTFPYSCLLSLLLLCKPRKRTKLFKGGQKKP